MELRKFIATTIREYLNEQQEVETNLNNNFRKWFSGSKVVYNGKPLPVYHGSPENFDEFKQMILEPLLKKTRVYEKAKTDNTLRVNPEEALKEAVEVYANDLKRNPKKIEEAIEELVDGQEQKEKST